MSPLIYFRQKRDSEKKILNDEEREIKRASSNICRELLNTFDALDRTKHPDESKSFKTDTGKEIFFMNRIFNHDFYDSLIFSGKINFLEPELQQPLQDIFRMIKEHNEYLRLTKRIKHDKEKQPPKETHIFYIWMNEYEEKLLVHIPEMMNRLESTFGDIVTTKN